MCAKRVPIAYERHKHRETMISLSFLEKELGKRHANKPDLMEKISWLAAEIAGSFLLEFSTALKSHGVSQLPEDKREMAQCYVDFVSRHQMGEKAGENDTIPEILHDGRAIISMTHSFGNLDQTDLEVLADHLKLQHNFFCAVETAMSARLNLEKPGMAHRTLLGFGDVIEDRREGFEFLFNHDDLDMIKKTGAVIALALPGADHQQTPGILRRLGQSRLGKFFKQTKNDAPGRHFILEPT